MTEQTPQRAELRLQPPQRSAELSSPAWSLRIGQGLWFSMASHINHRGHGGALLCGVAERREGSVLLAREFVPAVDGIDYIPSTVGHGALSPTFITGLAKRARREKWALLFVHGHGEHGFSVGFSSIDFESHESGYPAVLDIVGGLPVGALVITDHAVAGDVWQPDGRRAALAATTIIGPNITTVHPSPPPRQHGQVGDDRQARLFGVAGRELLAATRVAVVGAGGAGSLLVELLARLGVGERVIVDPDRVEIHNLPRLVSARRLDALDFVNHSPWNLLPARLRRWLALRTRYKTAIATRSARRANADMRVEQHRLDVSDPIAAAALTSCDWIMLAADTATARLVVNKIAHQYLIPATQVGVKVDVDREGTVSVVHAVSRMVTPEVGCLDCQGLIDHTALATEALPEALRRAADYGTGEPAPAVAALNALAVGPAVSDMMMALTGLSQQTEIVHHRLLARRGKWARIAPRRAAACSTCSTTATSALARGAGLPIGGVRLR